MIISSNLTEARRLEEQLLQEVASFGYEEADTFAIKLALEEGLVNAIKHGNKYDAKKTVRVVSQIDENEASFTITDEGPGFHLEEVPDPTADENLERPCGRGLMLIRAFMDEVSYNETGNQVHLVKRRTRQENK